MEEGMNFIPDFPAWFDEADKKSVVFKLTSALDHVNKVLYEEADCRINLIKAHRLIKKREALRRKLDSLNRQRRHVKELLRENDEQMRRAAYGSLY